ncbi:hypothetical protein SAMN02910291_01209 [Desulfovibrio desulfuricans]|uniref:Uncharacterized protein n=1 Tax=Desulfovibrio desulfuricans TaxID=876 RepID=A0AA94HSA0_DESDE|nr:hypothetical protein SAMN02910291_01209 [Desulfovibrio desulfuricans]SPD34658.1 Hypothetical protein DSVG11_0535 [Desulfovibrio sp. G11]
MHGGIKFFVSYEESRGRIPGFPDMCRMTFAGVRLMRSAVLWCFFCRCQFAGAIAQRRCPLWYFLQGPAATGRWLSDFAFFHHFRYLCHILVSPAGKVDQQDGILRHARGHLDGMCQGVG